jgi:hypothetical protein
MIIVLSPSRRGYDMTAGSPMADHGLGMASNVLSGEARLQDIEERRQNEVYLDALRPSGFPILPRLAGALSRS